MASGLLPTYKAASGAEIQTPLAIDLPLILLKEFGNHDAAIPH